MPLSDNRQFRTERQDDRWQLLLGPLQEIQDVFAAQNVRIVFVEEHDLWIIQAPPQLIGVSKDGAKPIKKGAEIRMVPNYVLPRLVRQLDELPERTRELPRRHTRNLTERGSVVNQTSDTFRGKERPV